LKKCFIIKKLKLPVLSFKSFFGYDLTLIIHPHPLGAITDAAEIFVHRGGFDGCHAMTRLAFDFHLSLHQKTFAEQLVACRTAVFIIGMSHGKCD